MTDTIQTPEVINPALVKLANVVTEVQIPDMNYLFHYRRVKKPDGVLSDYFALCYKEAQQENWSVCRSLLSKVFTVAKTQMVIQQIQESLGGDIQSERHYRSETSVSSTFTLSGFSIDVPAEPEIDTVLFKLITNIDSNINITSTSGLTFNVLNGMSGNHALTLSFGLLRTILSNDKVVTFNNIFLLDKFTKKLIHNNTMSVNITDVTNVQRTINDQIIQFKKYIVTQAIAVSICNKLPKKFAKKFMVMYENLPENIRSFYYITYILSMLIDNEKNVSLEIKLRSCIMEAIGELIASEV